MQRRTFIGSGTAALSAASLPSWTRFLHITDYEMKILRRNVGFFTEKGGTIGYLIQPEGIVVVDTQWKEQSEHLIAELKAAGYLKEEEPKQDVTPSFTTAPLPDPAPHNPHADED